MFKLGEVLGEVSGDSVGRFQVVRPCLYLGDVEYRSETVSESQALNFFLGHHGSDEAEFFCFEVFPSLWPAAEPVASVLDTSEQGMDMHDGFAATFESLFLPFENPREGKSSRVPGPFGDETIEGLFELTPHLLDLRIVLGLFEGEGEEHEGDAMFDPVLDTGSQPFLVVPHHQGCAG